MHLNLSQLRAFAAVARWSSFTKAANALHTTQPALSAKIQQLEEAVGATLFDRTTRTVAPTRIARDILPSVEKILGETEALIYYAKDVSSGITGRVVVAALPSVCSTILPKAIAQFHSEWPGISIALRDALTERIVEMVRSDEVDFGIGSPVVGDPQFDFTFLGSDHMAVVTPLRHPLSAMRRPRLKHLLDFPLILMDRNSSVRRIVDQALLEQGRASQALYEVAYMSTAIGMVRAGLGVTVLPTTALEVKSASDLSSRRLMDPSLTRKIGVLRRRGRSSGAVVDRFLGFLSRSFETLAK